MSGLSIATGESQLPRPFTADEFKEPCDAEFMTTFFCSWYGVDEPTLKHNPAPATSIQFRGRYHPKTKMLSFNQEWQGVMLHELAHHITHELGRNGTGKHGYEFSSLLQEMIDNWR